MSSSPNEASRSDSDRPAVNVKLLRALALGGKRSVEIQLILDSATDETDYRQLAWILSGLSVSRKAARETLQHLLVVLQTTSEHVVVQ